jgi:hypothetical protein
MCRSANVRVGVGPGRHRRIPAVLPVAVVPLVPLVPLVHPARLVPPVSGPSRPVP